MNPYALFAIAVIWTSTTVGAILMAAPPVFVAAVAGTIIVALWECNA